MSRSFLLLKAQVRRLGVHMNVGRVTAGTADPKSPKGHSISYGIIFSLLCRGKKKERGEF